MDVTNVSEFLFLVPFININFFDGDSVIRDHFYRVRHLGQFLSNR